MRKSRFFLALLGFITLCFHFYSVVLAQTQTPELDSDQDGLSDSAEANIFFTDPFFPDTDGDGYLDGLEVFYKFDPNTKAPGDRLEKSIIVSISSQELSYLLGRYVVGKIKVSTGTKRYPTPKGEYKILKKMPVHLYKGSNYYYPNTRWNMQFLPSSKGSFYIHGAYWHNKFGTPMSHGCVNVSYTDMENLYNWTDIGTKVIIN